MQVSGDLRALPTGTVTFFFSDIEGSTRLLEALGPDYPDLLDRHRSIVREAFSRWRAVEINTQGDSFFAAFASPSDAIAAAVAIQRAIAAEPWPKGVTLRVRIGLHTGEAQVAGDDYVGLDVHRAARIMAAAHGGQIVVSDTTHALAQRALHDGIELQDLGQHRLRDLTAPERLFEVQAAGVRGDFPALRTLDITPNNLPTQPSVLVGREAELKAIGDLLDSASVRLVTLTGPGGIGKTRLALQAAAEQVDRATDGVYFVDLSNVRDADGALHEIVRAVGLTISTGDELREALAEQLGTRRVLLLLDNFEQVMAAAEDVADLLRSCPHIRFLVTSREALRVRGEHLFPVAPLSLPREGLTAATAQELARYEAIHLFIERAREARRDFAIHDDNAAVVAEICVRLDGLPLAIELAAARLKLFSPDELRDRLRSRLDVLRGGARDLPARQRTLRGTIEWSYELLDGDERAIFQLLSVFSGSRIDAVEEVASRVQSLADIDVVDRLASLVDKSLIRTAAEGGRERLSMLETIREYGTEQLDRDPHLGPAARRAHAEYFVEFALARRADLRVRREAALDELASELGNLETAWRFFVAQIDLTSLTTLLDALWALYDARGWYHGALRLANDLLGVLNESPAAAERAEEEIAVRMTLARGLLAIRGYTDEVERLYREALAAAERIGAMPKRLSVLKSLASFHLYRAEIDKTLPIGRELLELADREGDTALQLEGHVILGPALAFLGEAQAGLDHLDRAIALFDPQRHGAARFRFGPNPGVVATAVSALLLWVFGYPERAARRGESALELAARLQHPYSLAYATFHVSLLSVWSRRLDVARDRALEVLRIAEQHDYRIWRAVGLVLDGLTTAALGDPDAGLARTEHGIALYEDLPTPPVFWPTLLALRGQVCAMAGRTSEALDLLDTATTIAGEGSWDSAEIKVLKADLLASSGDAAGAEALLLRAYEEGEPLGVRAIQLQAATRLARLHAKSGQPDGAELLREIYGTFTEGFDTPDLVDARAALELAGA